MGENHDKGKIYNIEDLPEDFNSDQRCGFDRRKEDREGYTYISMVGWICRREQIRRRPGNGSQENFDDDA